MKMGFGIREFGGAEFGVRGYSFLNQTMRV